MKWAQGVYVAPSEDVRHGHVVRFADGTFVTSLHLKNNLVDADELVDLSDLESGALRVFVTESAALLRPRKPSLKPQTAQPLRSGFGVVEFR